MYFAGANNENILCSWSAFFYGKKISELFTLWCKRIVHVFSNESLYERQRNNQSSQQKELKHSLAVEQISFKSYFSQISLNLIGTDEKMKTEELEEYELALSMIMFGKDTLKQSTYDLDFMPFTFTLDERRDLSKFWSEGANVPPSFMQKMLLKQVSYIFFPKPFLDD